MDIKTFDIVEVYGITCRVMGMSTKYGTVKASFYGDVELNDVKLVESVIIPTFEVGDEVTIIPIPVNEQRNYPYGWGNNMSRMMNNAVQCGTTYTVTDVRSSKHGNGFRYQLNDTFVFAPYHLKKVVDYDFV